MTHETVGDVSIDIRGYSGLLVLRLYDSAHLVAPRVRVDQAGVQFVEDLCAELILIRHH